MTASTGPSGRNRARLSEADVATTSSWSIDSACSANQRSALAHFATSPFAAAKVLPISVVITLAMSGTSPSNRSAALSMRRARSWNDRTEKSENAPADASERLVDGGVVVRVEGLLGDTCCRIDGCDGHVRDSRGSGPAMPQGTRPRSAGCVLDGQARVEYDVEGKGETSAAAPCLQELVHRRDDHIEAEPFEQPAQARGTGGHDDDLADHDRVGAEGGRLFVFEPDRLCDELLRALVRRTCPVPGERPGRGASRAGRTRGRGGNSDRPRARPSARGLRAASLSSECDSTEDRVL